MKDPKDLPSPPKAAVADNLHAVVRAGIGAVPLVPCTEGQLVLSPVAPYDNAWAWEGLAHVPIRS